MQGRNKLLLIQFDVCVHTAVRMWPHEAQVTSGCGLSDRTANPPVYSPVVIQVCDNWGNESVFFFPSCWKAADWNEGPRSQVARLPATCPDTTKLPRMGSHGAASPSKARPALLLAPRRRVATTAPISPPPSTSLPPGSKKSPSTSPATWRSWTRRPPTPRPNTSKTATRCTPEPSSASRPHPVSYRNRPATGSAKTSPSAAAKAESKWLFTWSLCWSFQISRNRCLDTELVPAQNENCFLKLAFNAPQYDVSSFNVTVVQFPVIQRSACICEYFVELLLEIGRTRRELSRFLAGRRKRLLVTALQETDYGKCFRHRVSESPPAAASSASCLHKQKVDTSKKGSPFFVLFVSARVNVQNISWTYICVYFFHRYFNWDSSFLTVFFPTRRNQGPLRALKHFVTAPSVRGTVDEKTFLTDLHWRDESGRGGSLVQSGTEDEVTMWKVSPQMLQRAIVKTERFFFVNAVALTESASTSSQPLLNTEPFSYEH